MVGEGGHAREALRLFMQMRADGLEPGLSTYNVLLGALDAPTAEELFQEMVAEGVVSEPFGAAKQ